MIITSGYVYNNLKLTETRNIVENTLEERKQKYSGNYPRSVKVECVATFLDKIKNETKNITINSYIIIGELKKIMQSSKGMINFIRVIQVINIIESRIRIYDIVLSDFCLECENNLILWKKNFMRIVKKDDKDFFKIVVKSTIISSMEDNITSIICSFLYNKWHTNRLKMF